MSDYKLAYEILGMAETGLAMSNTNEETFGMACEIYRYCIPTQICEADSARFEKIPKRVREKERIPKRVRKKEEYPIKRHELKNFAHWLYKRCEPKKRDDYRVYFNRLVTMDPPEIEEVQKSIKGAIECFESSRNILDASQLLSSFWEGAAFTTCTLFLSSFFPEEVSFLSPELIHCFKHDMHLPNEESPDETTLYTKLQEFSLKTVQRIEEERVGKVAPRNKEPINRLKVEQVAYVLHRLKELEDLYYKPDLVIQEEQIDGAGIFKARAANHDNNPFQELGPLLAMKEQSIVAERRIVDYLSEIGISSRLKSPHIIAFHGWTYKLKHIRIVMDLMTTNLENRLGKRGTWITRSNPPSDSSRLLLQPLQQLLDGLKVIHQQGITHRDIKPENIFLDTKDNVVLGDFGVSRQARNGIKTTLETSTGTPTYMAPEVIISKDQKQAYTSKADVWAVGCVLFRMIFGSPLIRENTVSEIEEAVDNFRNGHSPCPPSESDSDSESESDSDSKSTQTSRNYAEKDLNEDQRQFLYELIDYNEPSRLSVSDALSRCDTVWNDY